MLSRCKLLLMFIKAEPAGFPLVACCAGSLSPTYSARWGLSAGLPPSANIQGGAALERHRVPPSACWPPSAEGSLRSWEGWEEMRGRPLEAGARDS